MLTWRRNSGGLVLTGNGSTRCLKYINSAVNPIIRELCIIRHPEGDFKLTVVSYNSGRLLREAISQSHLPVEDAHQFSEPYVYHTSVFRTISDDICIRAMDCFTHLESSLADIRNDIDQQINHAITSGVPYRNPMMMPVPVYATINLPTGPFLPALNENPRLRQGQILPTQSEFAIQLSKISGFDPDTIPDEFCCPLCGDIMCDPVIDPTTLNQEALTWLNIAKEKSDRAELTSLSIAIDERKGLAQGNLNKVSRFERRWLQQAADNKNGESPVTRQPVGTLISDALLKGKIEDYVRSQQLAAATVALNKTRLGKAICFYERRTSTKLEPAIREALELHASDVMRLIESDITLSDLLKLDSSTRALILTYSSRTVDLVDRGVDFSRLGELHIDDLSILFKDKDSEDAITILASLLDLNQKSIR
jgi:hypothetical protein